MVAAHKLYPMPEDPLYLPVQAGAALHDPLPYTGDNTGENISRKNDAYCELTVLYWAWKNLPADVLGLCHYRRYFREPGRNAPLMENTLRSLMADTAVILPEKRNYYIETGESQFVHAHGQVPYDALRETLREQAPNYLSAFDASMHRTAGHRFNMLIMRREQLDAYCAWLFPILEAVEARLIPMSPRMPGFLAERLLDSWIETKQISYKELPVYQTEKTNWLKKGGAFLLRKFRGGPLESDG